MESEKMAVIIQEMVGERHGDCYYPDFAGVVQSYNFFPVGVQKPEDGIAQVAIGLGTTVVRGEAGLRFSPRHPGILPQFHLPEDVLAHSQKEFLALDLTTSAVSLTRNEEATLKRLDLAAAEEHGVLEAVGGTFSLADRMVFDDLHHKGPRVVTFGRVLKSNAFPLSPILRNLLEVGRAGMGCPVEIEFAVKLNRKAGRPEFHFLQIRPLLTGIEGEDVRIDDVVPEQALCLAGRALGYGVNEEIADVVYTPPERFDRDRTVEVARQVGEFNARLSGEGRPYFLLGLGRWGTAVRRLGVPVNWAQISAAKVIAEVSVEGFVVEPSQGTHFFQNITASRIGYLFLDTSRSGRDRVDWQWLDGQPAVSETEFVRHVRLERPLVVRIDGRVRRGVVLKPKARD
jgi:hypothetical protein